ncbi:uncharacterized protein LOC123672968 [Harmonia axyridis]|uniref:uncharacterized protein LOC123672968 n=1 Tax=Harmonia axyridis TaxID=115357 RepID=UPI001E275273|nr:uncharacterized protein LOC123672968 [Harmonia axyridis]
MKVIRLFLNFYRCVKDMNESVGYTFIAQCLLTTLFTATMVFITITEDPYATLMTLGCFLYLYIFCRVGQFLEDEHEKLVESVKFLPWYKIPPRMRQNYRFFLGTVQIPIHFRIKPLLKVNKEYLLFIVRGSYSMATFMMNLASRK